MVREVEPLPCTQHETGSHSDILMGDSVRTPGPPSKRLRLLVLGMVLTTEWIVNILSASMVPFFPDYAMDTFGASDSIIGIIFALYPLSLFVTSLFVGYASARFGRILVYACGLILLGGATWAFGFSDSLGLAFCLGMRIVQGIGGGCIQVAGMALLLQVSDNIERDVGLDQVAIGLGYIVGPPAGGLLFSAMGFRNMYLMLGAIPLLQLYILPYVARVLSSGAKPLSSVPGTPSFAPPVPFRRMLARPVIVVGLMSFIAFTALGILDPLALPHLERSLGTSIQTVGAIYMIPCIVFTIISLMAEGFIKALGYRRAISSGLVLMSAGLLCLGPAPFFLELAWTRSLMWVVQILGFVLFGIGFAFVVVTVVPLMNAYLSWAGPEKEDFISSVSSACGSLGEFMGPFLGGVMGDYMPQRIEVSCRQSAAITDCRTGASYATFAFACILVTSCFGFWIGTPEPLQGKAEEPVATPTEEHAEVVAVDVGASPRKDRL